MVKVESLAAGIEIGESYPSQAPVLEKQNSRTTNKRKNDSEITSGPEIKLPRILHHDPNPQKSSQDSTLCDEHVLQQLPILIHRFLVVDAANPLGLLNNALSKFKLRPEYTFTDKSHMIPTEIGKNGKKKKPQINFQWEATMHISDVFVTSAMCSSKIEAKRLCGEAAIKLLGKEYLIIREVARNVDGQKVMRKEVIAPALTKKSASDDNQQKSSNPLSRFVIMVNDEDNAICTIQNSCQLCKMTVSYDFKDVFENVHGAQCNISKHVCKVSIEGQVVGVGVHSVKKDAKRLAAEKALNRLRKSCPTVKVNKEIEETLSKQQLLKNPTADLKLPESNIGSQLMKKMGWSGGGLGKEGNLGRETPVTVEQQFSREGLGMGRPVGKDQIDYRKAQDIIKQYAASDNMDALVFSSELTLEERKLIHQAARNCSLKSTSRGQGDQRQLVVERKQKATEIVEHLAQSGGTSARYQLILPEQSSI
ncbi:NF-kappa-B-repressing factor-like isoform X2 [Glandiceps talaboti]